MATRSDPAAGNGIAPGRAFWALLALAFLGILAVAAATGWAGALMGDVLGLAGSGALIYGTASSLGTRDVLNRIAALETGESTRAGEEVLTILKQHGADDTRRDLRREWRATIIGAMLLAAAFAVNGLGELI